MIRGTCTSPAPGLSGHFADPALKRLSELVYRESAIVLGPEKAMFVKARLSQRFRQLGCENVAAYIARVEQDRSGHEIRRMINLITTHETSFFRENAHFEFLTRKCFPHAVAPLKIWSAGCASGEEPYSIAITALEAAASRVRQTCVLATDISSSILATAKTGRYEADRLEPVSEERKRRFFTRSQGQQGTTYEVRPAIRERVSFAQLNLALPWPMRGPFDVIFCRNVMIYFARPFQLDLARRFAKLLRPGGHLCIGHSESLGVPGDELTLVQPALYRKDG